MNNHTENMNLEHIKQQVRYLTNEQGKTYPLEELWEGIKK